MKRTQLLSIVMLLSVCGMMHASALTNANTEIQPVNTSMNNAARSATQTVYSGGSNTYNEAIKANVKGGGIRPKPKQSETEVSATTSDTGIAGNSKDLSNNNDVKKARDRGWRRRNAANGSGAEYGTALDTGIAGNSGASATNSENKKARGRAWRENRPVAETVVNN